MADLRAEIVALNRRVREFNRLISELERRAIHQKATSDALTKARLAGHDVQDFARALIFEVEATMTEHARLRDAGKDLENEVLNTQHRLRSARPVQLDLFPEEARR
jgi:septal ring factor EnvC (AmiA/AmiB activator)